MGQHSEAEQYDDSRSNLFARVSRWFGGDHYEEEDEETEVETPSPAPDSRASGGSLNPLRRATPAPALRLDTARRTHITVRRAVQSFDDARRAADGLKEGLQQIINLEQTAPDMAERIIDFLNGATYAIDGSVEKIGEQVYLFTPSTVMIDVEDKPAPVGRASFFDHD